MSKNKKGLATINMPEFLVYTLIGVIFFGVFGLVFYWTNFSLNQNVTIGQVNLATINAQTFGKMNTAFIANADYYGMAVLFGMLGSMFLIAYLTRGKNHKLLIILDIVILFICYIASVYLSNSYETLINSTSYLDYFTSNMPKSSIFILRLPTIISIVGVILMVLNYSGIPKFNNEDESLYDIGGGVVPI